jgi:hypothetical protein
MSDFKTTDARTLGAGFTTPLGAVTHPGLAEMFRNYKRTIASRYRALSNDDLEREGRLPLGPVHLQPKVDGELWFLVMDGDEAWLSNPRGRVIYGDIPVLGEARAFAARARGSEAVGGRTVLAGELFALRKAGRPRHDDLARATRGGSEAEVARVGVMAFDLLAGGDTHATTPLNDYGERIDCIRRLLEGGKRLQAMHTELVEGRAPIAKRYAEFVESQKAEGLILRTAEGRIAKLKPSMTLDAVVVGFTDHSDDPEMVGAMLLAMMREEGQFQLIGSCGGMDSATRRALRARLIEMEAPSTFRQASHRGAMYRFVRPELVVEVKVTDVLADESDGGPVMRMVCTYDAEDGWRAVQRMPGVSILHAVLQRERTDKGVDAVDIRMGQVLERVLVPEVEARAEARSLPRSEPLVRAVYTKETKGRVAVRKVVMWRTNKDQSGDGWPAYVVHFTDYSPGRKEPLKREVRCAPDEEAARTIVEDMLAANIKRGWEEVGET